MAKFKLNIPDPCSQKWEEMKRTTDGAFCNSCRKEVVDFTGMSDREIRDFFSKRGGKLCGRITKRQLLQPYVSVDEPSFSWKRYLMAFMVFSGVSTYARAEQSVSVQPELLQQQPAETKASIKKELTRSTQPGDTLQEIRGQVMDGSTGELLPGVSVRINGSRTGVVTDLDGKFTLSGKLLKPTDAIEFAFVGYKTKLIPIYVLFKNADVALELDEEVLNEVVYVGGIHSAPWWSPRGMWWRIKGLFR